MKLHRLLCASVCVVAMLACANVDPKPFQRFQESASNFETASDAALASAQGLAKAGFATPSPFGVETTFDSVVLTFDEDPTRPEMDAAPLYLQLREIRLGTSDLNGALADYSGYLALLAGGSEKDAEELEELARKANTNLRSARDALQLEAGDREVALIATIGTELLRQKIEHDRRNYLRDTMTHATPAIQEFSDFMVTTMDLVATDVQMTYAEWAETQRRAHQRASGDDKKRKVIEGVLERNDQTLLLLDSIRTLREAYREIPTAHREVLASLDEKEPFLVGVKRLYADARRLEKLQKELASAESK